MGLRGSELLHREEVVSKDSPSTISALSSKEAFCGKRTATEQQEAFCLKLQFTPAERAIHQPDFLCSDKDSKTIRHVILSPK